MARDESACLARQAGPAGAEMVDSSSLDHILPEETGGGVHGRPVWPIIVVQFLYILAISTSIPVAPFIWTSTPLAAGDEVRGATLHSFGVFINAGCEFLSAAFLGSLSDSFGRKPFLLLASLGQVFDMASAGFAAPSMDGEPMAPNGHLIMFGARAAAGLLGNMSVFTKASVGDMSAPARRTTSFSLLLGMFGLAFIIGPPLGIILVDRFGPATTMLACAAANVINVVLVAVMPEPLLPKNRVPMSWRKASPVGVLYFFMSSDFLKFFGVMSFLDQFAITLLTTIILQYAVTIYGVSAGLSTSLAIVFGLGQPICYALVLRPIVRRFGEMRALNIGYAMTCVSFMLMALVTRVGIFWAVYPVMIAFAVGSISNPTEVALASRCVNPTDQGKLQAANGALDVVGKMSGALLVSLVWEPSVHANWPSAIWWLACLVMVPGVIISFRLKSVLPCVVLAAHDRGAESLIASAHAETKVEVRAGDGGEASKGASRLAACVSDGCHEVSEKIVSVTDSCRADTVLEPPRANDRTERSQASLEERISATNPCKVDRVGEPARKEDIFEESLTDEPQSENNVSAMDLCEEEEGVAEPLSSEDDGGFFSDGTGDTFVDDIAVEPARHIAPPARRNVTATTLVPKPDCLGRRAPVTRTAEGSNVLAVLARPLPDDCFSGLMSDPAVWSMVCDRAARGFSFLSASLLLEGSSLGARPLDSKALVNANKDRA